MPPTGGTSGSLDAGSVESGASVVTGSVTAGSVTAGSVTAGSVTAGSLTTTSVVAAAAGSEDELSPSPPQEATVSTKIAATASPTSLDIVEL